MPYPDEFEGFMITKLGDYKNFTKKTVGTLRPTTFLSIWLTTAITVQT